MREGSVPRPVADENGRRDAEKGQAHCDGTDGADSLQRRHLTGTSLLFVVLAIQFQII